MVVVTLTRRSSFFVRQVVEVVAAVVLEVLVAVIVEEVAAVIGKVVAVVAFIATSNLTPLRCYNNAVACEESDCSTTS